MMTLHCARLSASPVSIQTRWVQLIFPAIRNLSALYKVRKVNRRLQSEQQERQQQ